jgi:hypothetical protein
MFRHRAPQNCHAFKGEASSPRSHLRDVTSIASSNGYFPCSLQRIKYSVVGGGQVGIRRDHRVVARDAKISLVFCCIYSFLVPRDMLRSFQFCLARIFLSTIIDTPKRPVSQQTIVCQVRFFMCEKVPIPFLFSCSGFYSLSYPLVS